jgi:GT2 family glycosyltransferase
MKPRFSISILTYSNLAGVKACLSSVLKSTQPFNLILTANGNPQVADYFLEFAEEFQNVRVIINSTNQGFIEPNRFAFGLMETPFGIFLNDDATVPPDWLEKLVAPFGRDTDMAIVGQENACCYLGRDFSGFRHQRTPEWVDYGKHFEYVEFSCAMVSTTIMRKLGLFAPYIEFANCEDSDASLRAREAGYKIARARFSITHEVGATRKHVPGLAEIYQKNLAACQVRWVDYLKSNDRKFPHEK